MFKAILLTLVCATFAAQAQNARTGTVNSTFPSPAEVTDKDGWRPHIGVRAGLTDPNENYNSTSEYGVEFGFQPYIPFGAGVVLSTMNSGSENAGRTDLERTKLMIRGTYNFGGLGYIISNSFLGVAHGAVFDSADGQDETRFGTELVGGVDFPLNRLGMTVAQSFTLGANANYLFVSNSGADSFGVNGILKYWF